LSDQELAAFREAYGRALTALRLGRPQVAEQQLRAIQASAPGEVNSLRVLGIALSAQGRHQEAIAALESVCARAPGFAHAFVDLAAAFHSERRFEEGERASRKALELDPNLAVAWRQLGDLQVSLGRQAEALASYARWAAGDPSQAPLADAAAALVAGDRHRAEGSYRALLREDPNDVGALCGLAVISLGAGFVRDAERLLRHALKQSPHLPLIWRGLAQTLFDGGRFAEAEDAIEQALDVEPELPESWVLLGNIRARRLRSEGALAAYDRALGLKPDQPRVLLSQGHVLKTLGRRAECEAVYHESVRRYPEFAEAYCSLADLKNYEFTDAELDAMRALAARTGVESGELAQLHFALGRALEQRENYDGSFAHYAAGNRARRRVATFDAAAFEDKSRRVIESFGAAFLAAHAGGGCPDAGPIFIVGLPRSGSTLVEQILASHPAVQGTMELPNLVTIVRELDSAAGVRDRYPESVAPLGAGEIAALGARYIAETRELRAGRERFIDKMPNNFSHVGLLQLILPNATIVDVRRHPMDACFSAFKQYFAQGQSFAFDLEDLGRYYRTYLRLMDHWDRVLPGKVLCIAYEDLIADTEGQVRRLLAHCQLPFDSACLRFYETRRAVRTASSEQVRQPIYDSSVGYWRRYAAHLEPLRWSLGPALERFDRLVGR
jgi:predicted Zn-dependent protease